MLKREGYEVVGISADSEHSHMKFTEKFELPFRLIPDTDKKIIRDYGVWGAKKFMGREYDGILRTTFVIDANGIIENIFTKVNTGEHAKQIIEGMK